MYSPPVGIGGDTGKTVQATYTTFLNGFGRYLMDAFEPSIDVAKDPSFAVVRKVVKAMKAKAQATKGKKEIQGTIFQIV